MHELEVRLHELVDLARVGDRVEAAVAVPVAGEAAVEDALGDAVVGEVCPLGAAEEDEAQARARRRSGESERK